HQSDEEAWSSGTQEQKPGTYYPSQTQYTYAYSTPAPASTQQQPQAGGVGFDNHMYNSGPPPPPPAYNPQLPTAPPEDFEANKPPEFSAALAFSAQSIRAAFIRKVFGLVTLMLLIVVAECAVAVFVPSVNEWLMGGPYGDDYGCWILLGSAMVAFFILYCAILCVPNLRKSFPINIILAFLMAACLGALVAQLCAFYTVDSIILCVALLVVSVASIAAFSIQTKFDMRQCAGVVILLTMYLFWIGIFSFGYMWWWYGARWYYMLYSVIACTLFMIYLAIDIQLIMGGRRKFAISPEEYVYAAVQIFIDVVYIFIYLLQILGVVKN
ncbi:hypothetical protein PMAYCL1PPCAC_28151, partial [Pristionchus mayeri]